VPSLSTPAPGSPASRETAEAEGSHLQPSTALKVCQHNA
jgi:hypothetical protein